MGDVFISYRREDSAYALLLYDRLGSEFGRDRVFRDLEDIQPGHYFDEVIAAELRASKAMVTIIGPGWSRAQERLRAADDWVRREILLAFGRRMVMLPVLVGGARMPTAADLPAELADMTRPNALELSDTRFHRDADQLVDALATLVPRRPPEAFQAPDAHQRAARELLRRQVARLQVRAVELIQEGKVDRAREELAAGSELLMLLMDWSPADVDLQVQLGYLYKTLAQAFAAAGDRQHAERYLDLAASTFENVRQRPADTAIPIADLAGVMNGIGNVYAERGQLDRAIEMYRAAIELVPSYAYAWHDLFAALDAKARGGALDLPAMRDALAKVKATGAGLPGLSAAHLAELDALLAHWDRVGAAPPTPAAPARAPSSGRRTAERRRRR